MRKRSHLFRSLTTSCKNINRAAIYFFPFLSYKLKIVLQFAFPLILHPAIDWTANWWLMILFIIMEQFLSFVVALDSNRKIFGIHNLPPILLFHFILVPVATFALKLCQFLSNSAANNNETNETLLFSYFNAIASPQSTITENTNYIWLMVGVELCVKRNKMTMPNRFKLKSFWQAVRVYFDGIFFFPRIACRKTTNKMTKYVAYSTMCTMCVRSHLKLWKHWMMMLYLSQHRDNSTTIYCQPVPSYKTSHCHSILRFIRNELRIISISREKIAFFCLSEFAEEMKREKKERNDLITAEQINNI